MKQSKIYFKLIGVLIGVFLFSCNENRIGENEFGMIKGTVVVSGSNVPLANVRISTDPITSTVFTDSIGQFLIENAPVGDYAVQAKIDGYITDVEPTTVVANVPVNVVFELEVSTAKSNTPGPAYKNGDNLS